MPTIFDRLISFADATIAKARQIARAGSKSPDWRAMLRGGVRLAQITDRH